MFGSEEAARVVIRELATLPEVVAAVGDRGYFAPLYAGDSPGFLVYPIFTQYDGPVSTDGTPTFERIDLEVRFIDDRNDAGRIRAAALASLGHLANAGPFRETVNGTNWYLSFTPAGESPPHLVDQQTGDLYRQMGTVYTVEFSIGG